MLARYITYDAFGNIAAETDVAISHLFGYTGREFDKSTGLQYNRERYYDPKSGRFISQDPMSFGAGDANLYRYVGNHGTYGSDPSGLKELIPSSVSISGNTATVHLDGNGVSLGKVLKLQRDVNGDTYSDGRYQLASDGILHDKIDWMEIPRAEGWNPVIRTPQEVADDAAIELYQKKVNEAGNNTLMQEEALRQLQIYAGTYSFPGDMARPGGGFDKTVQYAGMFAGGDGNPNAKAAGAKRTPSGRFDWSKTDSNSFTVSDKTVRYNGGQKGQAGASPRVRPSPTSLELVEAARNQGQVQTEIGWQHILDGEVKPVYQNGIEVGKRAVGGHYARSGNIRIIEILEQADHNGVVVARIDVRDPLTGGWIGKRADSSLYPQHWSRREVQLEVEAAFRNSNPVTNDLWEGVSPSGIRIQGYYTKPNGGAVTAWPIHEG